MYSKNVKYRKGGGGGRGGEHGRIVGSTMPG